MHNLVRVQMQQSVRNAQHKCALFFVSNSLVEHDLIETATLAVLEHNVWRVRVHADAVGLHEIGVQRHRPKQLEDQNQVCTNRCKLLTVSV